MAAVLKHWRESASLIIATSKVSKGIGINLTRAAANELSSVETAANNSAKQAKGEQDEGNIGDNFEVLMMKRSSKSKFMPNLHVFPGGVADNIDFSSQWLSVFKQLGHDTQELVFSWLSEKSYEAPPMLKRERSPEFSALPPDVAFRICAIREAFEESGVLLARPAEASKQLVEQLHAGHDGKMSALNPSFIHEDAQVIKTWRKHVNQEPRQFLEMCQQLNLVPEIWCLHEWANWLTPTLAVENGRRFDTIFYVCCVDHKPEVEQDFGETVSALWASPSSYLSAYYRQQGGVAPPQVYELTRLLHFSSAQELLSSVSRSGRSRVKQNFPIPVVCKDANFAVLPGDELYPNSPNTVCREVLQFDLSLEELDRQHPGHNRMYGGRIMDMMITPGFTIKPPHGHVGPRVEVLPRLFHAKL